MEEELDIINALKSDTTKVYTAEELYWCTGGNTGALPTRITPSRIIDLKEGEIFSFGSNKNGLHAGGAARYAMDKFGAIWGQGEGLQGKSYAIPTMEGLDSMELAVERFIDFAIEHPEKKFYVTPVACGIAGHTADEVAPMFYGAMSLENVYLPVSFWKVLIELDEKLNPTGVVKVDSKPSICPKCGGRIAPIAYGYPSADMMKKSERGEVILGGCCITGEDPQWGCVDCGLEFRVE